MYKNCCCECDVDKEQKLQDVIAEYKGTSGALVPVLHEAQEIYGYLPIEVQKKIAEGLDIPLAEVYGVVTFYTQFSLEPKGKYRISVCMGTACYVKGAGQILDKLKELLGIDVGEVTDDGMFSLDDCMCIGACGLAPVIMINDNVHGKLTPDDLGEILSKYKNE
jgi:NADP-reducing hydrogenase subunit HndA